MTHVKKLFPAALCATALATLPMAAAAGQAGAEYDAQTGAAAQAPAGAQTGATTATTADVQMQISQLQTLDDIGEVTVIQVGQTLGADPGADALQDDMPAAAPDPQVGGQADDFGAVPEGEAGAQPAPGAGPAMEGEPRTPGDDLAADPQPGFETGEPGAPAAPGAGAAVDFDEAQLSELREAIEEHDALADALDEEDVESDDVVAIEVIGENDVIVYVRS